MARPGTLSALAGARLDRLTRFSERALQLAGDPRLGIALLLATGIANAAAAAAPRGGWLLATPAYLILLGAVTISGLAALAVRAPTAWREWRHPAPLSDSREALRASVAVPTRAPLSPAMGRAAVALREAGYRVAVRGTRETTVLAGVRRGWSQFAGLTAHLAIVLVVAGAGIGLAFGHETTFSLLNGEQALLDEPSPGFTDADASGLLDSARVVAGGTARVGPVDVSVGELTAYVTFLSRRDPGMAVLFLGAGLLVTSLAAALWFPRRRVTLRWADGSLRLLLRGGRLDDARPELARWRW